MLTANQLHKFLQMMLQHNMSTYSAGFCDSDALLHVRVAPDTSDLVVLKPNLRAEDANRNVYAGQQKQVLCPFHGSCRQLYTGHLGQDVSRSWKSQTDPAFGLKGWGAEP